MFGDRHIVALELRGIDVEHLVISDGVRDG